VFLRFWLKMKNKKRVLCFFSQNKSYVEQFCGTMQLADNETLKK